VVDCSRWNLVSWSKYELVSPAVKAEGVMSDVVGPTCYENDIWIARVGLPDLRPGEQVVFRGLGAYVASMARKMHGLQIPQEVLI
jgi:diaminopimelate decarboxylase